MDDPGRTRARRRRHRERERGCRGCRERERVDFNTHGTCTPTHPVGRRRVGWYTPANAVTHRARMDGCREVPPDGWMDARTTPPPSTRSQTSRPDVRARETTTETRETKRMEIHARDAAVFDRQGTSRDAHRGHRDGRGKSAVDGCRKKIYSRVKRLTSGATTNGLIERTQGDHREF